MIEIITRMMLEIENDIKDMVLNFEKEKEQKSGKVFSLEKISIKG